MTAQSDHATAKHAMLEAKREEERQARVAAKQAERDKRLGIKREPAAPSEPKGTGRAPRRGRPRADDTRA